MDLVIEKFETSPMKALPEQFITAELVIGVDVFGSKQVELTPDTVKVYLSIDGIFSSKEDLEVIQLF